MEEPEIAIVGTKGQVVIPQRIRRELGIGSKTKLAVYMRGNKLDEARVSSLGRGAEGFVFERLMRITRKGGGRLSERFWLQYNRTGKRSGENRA